jgi:hypothetical protein
MKPKKIKLSLNKETLAKLDNFQMGNVQGGGDVLQDDGVGVVDVEYDADTVALEAPAFLSLGSCHRTKRNCCDEGPAPDCTTMQCPGSVINKCCFGA